MGVRVGISVESRVRRRRSEGRQFSVCVSERCVIDIGKNYEFEVSRQGLESFERVWEEWPVLDGLAECDVI